MPQNQIIQELTAIAGFPDGSCFEAVVGDTLNCNPLATASTPTITLTQKPSGSSASMSSGSFTVDVAGVFLVSITNGTAVRQVTYYAFPAAVLGVKIAGGSGNQPVVTRTHLRALVASQNYGALAAGGTNALRTQLEGAAPTAFVPPVNFAVFAG